MSTFYVDGSTDAQFDVLSCPRKSYSPRSNLFPTRNFLRVFKEICARREWYGETENFDHLGLILKPGLKAFTKEQKKCRKP